MNKYMAYILDPELQEGVTLAPVGERFVRLGTTDKNSVQYKAKQQIKRFTDTTFKGA